MIDKPDPNQRYFDEKSIPLDVWQVLRTASLLSVGEFRIFEMAYQTWFGKCGDEQTIERFYIPYMFKDIVPPWVNEFCKKVIKLDQENNLDPQDFGIERLPESPELRVKGLDYLFLIGITFIGLVLLAQFAAHQLNLKCTLPPCY